MSPTSIPVLDLTPEIETLWDELNSAIQGVLRSTHFIMGPNVKALEGELASYLSVKHAIAVNSGTDALVIGLKALGIGPGDEVITTPFTFFATAEAISQLGATPVFVDIDPKTFNIDPDRIEEAVTSRTKAIIPVHLYGQAAEMDPILALAERHGLSIVEDVAQAFGADYGGCKLGTLGTLGAYSFFPSKNLGAYGDGGLIATNDDRCAEGARMLRVHGAKKKYYNEVVGYNSRLDEMQAAILRVKLPRIDEWNDGRRRVGRRYARALESLPGVTPAFEDERHTHVFHQYTIRVLDGRRDAVQKGLAERGVSTMIYYPVPVHRLPLYEGQYGAFPLAERAASEALSLPIWPQMSDEVQDRVVEALSETLSEAR